MTRLLAAGLPAVVLLAAIGMPLLLGVPTQAGCAGQGPAVHVDPASVSSSAVGERGWRGEQLVHAAIIARAGADAGVGVRGQQIGIMTAMGESSLRNLAHGDAAGPDSRGLFQQRAEGWGTLAERMDPHTASTSFFRALQQVEGWASLPMTIAAHRTQRNADPYHYQPFQEDARAVLAAIANVDVVQLVAGGACGVTPGLISSSGWTHPIVDARLGSGYGPRPAPCTGCSGFHRGQDFPAAEGTPVYAVADGVVTAAAFGSCGGNAVRIDHGGVASRYLHLSRMDVVPGAVVEVGRQIGRSGNTGSCTTGPHLHLEISVDGLTTDPVAFLASMGVVYP